MEVVSEIEINMTKEQRQHVNKVLGSILLSLYHGVERQLSHAIQTPGSLDYKAVEIITARDNVRMVMRKLGWKTQF